VESDWSSWETAGKSLGMVLGGVMDNVSPGWEMVGIVGSAVGNWSGWETGNWSGREAGNWSGLAAGGTVNNVPSWLGDSWHELGDWKLVRVGTSGVDNVYGWEMTAVMLVGRLEIGQGWQCGGQCVWLGDGSAVGNDVSELLELL
jgi:hypothetical protein